MVLDTVELAEIIDAVAHRLQCPSENLFEMFSFQNREEHLNELLELMLFQDLLESEFEYTAESQSLKSGKIVVIGQTPVQQKDLLGIVRSFNLNNERFEFCLDYQDAKSFNYHKLQNDFKYRVILVGPAPHNVVGKSDFGSMITEMEQSKSYPRLLRLEANGMLKITKTNFKEALLGLLKEEYIAA